MEAASPPRSMTEASVVTPIFTAQGASISSVSSATIAPGQGAYQGTSLPPSAAKPTPLPKDIFIAASAAPFFPFYCCSFL